MQEEGLDSERESAYETVVAMRGIVKRFGAVTAADGIDFDLRRGEIHALLGENGAGKSTLMNILYGLERPDGGVISVAGEPVEFRSPHDAIGRGIGMVHQHFKLVPRLTVTENVILGLDRRFRLPDLDAVGREIEALGEQNGLPIKASAVVADLSVGEQQRVEILRALHRGARVLILDEPTASLTPHEVEQLIDKLRRLAASGASIVIITHHLDEVMASADRVTVLRGGRNVATVRAQDTNPIELARLMVGRNVGILVSEATHDDKVDRVSTPGAIVLSLNSLATQANGPVTDLSVGAGEIVTIAGVEGNGQAELEDVLLGLRRATAGNYRVGGTDVTRFGPGDLLAAGVGFVHSDRYRRGLIRELPIDQNLVYDRVARPPFGTRLRIDFRAIAAHGAELIKRFSVVTPSGALPAGTLSGGNAQKVVLARAFSTDPQVIVAAQPTRGLDVGAIEFVWEQLRSRRDAGAAVLLITTDLEEVMALSDRCYVIYRGRLTETPIDRERIGLAMGGAGVDAA